jgi:hypothetical protein
MRAILKGSSLFGQHEKWVTVQNKLFLISLIAIPWLAQYDSGELASESFVYSPNYLNSIVVNLLVNHSSTPPIISIA